jgi:hypothetical protein
VPWCHRLHSVHSRHLPHQRQRRNHHARKAQHLPSLNANPKHHHAKGKPLSNKVELTYHVGRNLLVASNNAPPTPTHKGKTLATVTNPIASKLNEPMLPVSKTNPLPLASNTSLPLPWRNKSKSPLPPLRLWKLSPLNPLFLKTP